MRLLALDLSTTCTGWSLFPNVETPAPQYFGYLTPKVPGLTIMGYPAKQLHKMYSLCDQILEVIKEHKPDYIVIEEINRSKNRLGQKVLDGFHFVLLDRLGGGLGTFIQIVTFKDSDGLTGWRTDLGLRLTEEDKQLNKERKAWNKKLPKRSREKLPIINKKHLACRFVNNKFGFEFDVDKNKKDGDIVDSIAMGYAVCLGFDNYLKVGYF